MTPFKPRTASVVAILTAAAFVMAAFAQAPQGTQSDAGNPSATPPRAYPAPINLKVLPRDLNGQQIHDIMEQWGTELGVRCKACHEEDSDNVVSGGPARPRFAEDSKPMKQVARVMYTMTEEINLNFIARIENSGLPVTCGTCHRGQISPDPVAFPPLGQPSPTQAPPPPEERPSSR